MSEVLKVVVVSGGLAKPSRTLVLVRALADALASARPVQTRVIELSSIGARLGAVLQRAALPDDLEEHVRAIETADVLIVGSPVFRASYTGLFKHLFDLVHHESLTDVPVLLAATGGSERHALMIDHQLRPLFSFFQARTLAPTVYASEADFRDYAIVNPALRERISRTIARIAPQLAPRDPHAAAQRATLAA
ncbi:FMN reductase [Paraburkholderia sp. J67]|uniref:FMN reductase n=1 Tax=Paraburkholderia sp. J67 TaxID=2805435 RepID=UPI002ABE1553|nr:FMN reductase [Paraburkholderia sp. J67]